MNILDIENAIIDKLKTQIKDLHIQGFTQKSVEYAMKHPSGAILVTYKGSKYKDPGTVGIICQDKKIRFAVILMKKNLRVQDGGHTEAYESLELIKAVLTGFQIAGCSKMWPVMDEFINEKDGIWQYGILFEMLSEHAEIL